MTQYYEATGELRLKLLECSSELERLNDQMQEWAESVGAEHALFSDAFGSRRVVGARFTELPDSDAWLSPKGWVDTDYRPRLAKKAGKKLKAEMDSMQSDIRRTINRLVGIEEWSGYSFVSAGLFVRGGDTATGKGCRVIVCLGDDTKFKRKGTPPGLRRISDVAAERLKGKE